MHNSQVVDLHDVEAYWKSRNLVDDRHLPYYIRWRQQFLTGPGSDSRLDPEDAQRAFVEPLERDQVPEMILNPGIARPGSLFTGRL